MSVDITATENLSEIRKKAEELYRQKSEKSEEVPVSEEDILKLVHDLQIHQIELEMQNGELLKAQANLEISRNRYFDLYDIAPVGYFTLDKQGMILEANLTFANMLGVERQYLLKRGISSFVTPEYQDAIYSCRVNSFKEGGQTRELKFKKNDGTTFFAQCNCIVQDFMEKPRLRVAITDITALKKAEEEQRKLEEQLRHAQRMQTVGTLAGGVAHEFNNILQIMVGFADRINTHKEHKKKYAEYILEAGERGINLVKQLQDFTDPRPPQSTQLKLSDLVKYFCQTMRITGSENITIIENIGDDCGKILADHGQINQVLLNLFNNAVAAIEDKKGIIEIGLEQINIEKDIVNIPELKKGPCLKLMVKDNGQGMSAEIRERIFDPFFTTRDVGQGSGLGLSVVHGIIKKHNGIISVNSRRGEGTTFNIYFPVITEELEEKAENIEIIHRKGKEHILFVDDEKALHKLFGAFFEELGYTFTSTTEGREALEIFLKDPDRFDLVITDHGMPEMCGTELAREILKIKQVPIILLTGYDQTIYKDKADESGIYMCVNKPVKLGLLSNILHGIFSYSNKLSGHFN